MIGNISKSKGFKGDKGDPPRKGIDYWLDEDKQEIRDEAIRIAKECGIGRSTDGGGEIFNDYENNIAIGNMSHSEGGNTKTLTGLSYSQQEINFLRYDNNTIELSANDNFFENNVVYGFRISNINLDNKRRIEIVKVLFCQFDEEVGHWFFTIEEPSEKVDLQYPNELIINAIIHDETIESNYQHAEGKGNYAIGDNSHSEGQGNLSVGQHSHSEGLGTIAMGATAHSEGFNTNAMDNFSHTEGAHTIAMYCAHAEGQGAAASGQSSHAEGQNTKAIGGNSHAEGKETKSIGTSSHAEGYLTEATGSASHTEGISTKATGEYSHAEGSNSKATGGYAHAEGQDTTASGQTAHAEGIGSTASGFYSHSEGVRTEASGTASHAEGSNSKATKTNAHAEGGGTKATGIASHAEGNVTEASGDISHAEGNSTKATGNGSHAEGSSTEARGQYSHAEGFYTVAQGKDQHVQGRFNIIDNEEKYAHIVGGGSSTGRKNIHTLDWSGNAWFAGEVTIGNNKEKLATENVVDAKIAEIVESAPEALNTLNELSAALGDDPNFATTVLEQIGTKANKDLSNVGSEGVKNITEITFESSPSENITVERGEYFSGGTLTDFSLDGITSDSLDETYDSFRIACSQYISPDEYVGVIDIDSLPYKFSKNYTYTLDYITISRRYNTYESSDASSLTFTLEQQQQSDKIATLSEVLALIEEKIPSSGDEVSY